MPAGRYYVGDLCYVLHDEWNEVCDLTIKGHECLDGGFTLKDGRQFVMFGTAYGDGVYLGSDGKEYAVDSGTIGCIQMDNAPDANGLGHIVEFKEEFDCKSLPGYNANRGNLFFGNLNINTDPEPEEEEEYEEEDEEYED